jgi:2-polyprenyl-6-methoxyphenol hydroxylase-like FAD-dependent oxidoreductase
MELGRSRNRDALRAPVLVVGAGPTGLVLALWLTKQGVPVRIIDKAEGPGETSRAIAVQVRTLEFYQQFGMADQVIDEGLPVRSASVRLDGREAGSAQLSDFGHDLSPFTEFFILAYPQDEHEKLLIAKLNELGVQVERRTELIGFEQKPGSVHYVLRKPDRKEHGETPYLCGCDGARSTVRDGLAIGFPGGTYSQRFYVADVDASGADAQGRISFCLGANEFCIVLPVRHSGTIRLIGVVPQRYEGQETVSFDDLKEDAAGLAGITIRNLKWFSTYNVHHRVAAHFQQGRAFLLGDAAHIHSPAGGQGMNTGIGDAVNLAWKLADVLHGRAGAGLLSTYEAERIKFARRLVASTDRAFTLTTSRSAFGRFWRTEFLPGAIPKVFSLATARRFAFRVVSQTRITYRGSRLSFGYAGVAGGDRLPWVPSETGGNFAPLASFRWQLHIYGEPKAALVATAQAQGIEMHTFAWNMQARNVGLRRDAAYLIRPDGHIGLAEPNQNPERLRRYLLRFPPA